MRFEEDQSTHYFADVVLPLALPKAYTYQLTEEEAQQLKPGFRVAVPFGKQKIYTAIITKLHRIAPQTYLPKPIAAVLDVAPSITQSQLDFWAWLSSYYMCTLGEVMRAELPAALLLESESRIVCEEIDASVLV